MALSCRWAQTGTTPLMPCSLNCRRGGWRGGRGGQLCPETGRCGLQVCCCSSSMGTGCWRVHARRRWSPINSCTTSSATLGSTVFPKVFEVLRLYKEVLSEESSGGPLSSSSRATEKAVKVVKAAESCRLTDPVNTDEICQADYDRGDGARGSPHTAGARVNGLWCVDTSIYGRKGNAVLNIDKKSSPLLGSREVSREFEAGNSEEVDSLIENLYFTRIGGGDGFSIEDIDDNHYQDAHADLKIGVPRDDFWPAIEVERTLTKGQVTDKCVAFNQWRQYQPVMQDPEKHVDTRHFSWCIHHLLAVLSLPRVTTRDKEPICCEPEQMLGSRGEIKFSTCGSDEFYLHKPFLHLWNGFWVGPDDEDGWGFVEALVSPIDTDGLFCRT